MPWWAWTALAVAYCAAWRLTFRWLWEDDATPTWEAFWMCVLLATGFCWVGAIAAVCTTIAARISAAQAAHLLAGESRAAKRRRQKREFAKREQHIAQAERELGILPGERETSR